jgi:glutaredoxin
MGRRGIAMAAMTTLVLYTRPGCHLCDEARAELVALTSELDGVELREVDIETDDRLLAAYLERIPVVELDGEPIAELVVDRHAVRARVHTVPR